MRASQENTNFIIPLVIFHKRVLTVKNICHRKLLFNLYHQIPYGRVSLSSVSLSFTVSGSSRIKSIPSCFTMTAAWESYARNHMCDCSGKPVHSRYPFCLAYRCIFRENVYSSCREICVYTRAADFRTHRS